MKCNAEIGFLAQPSAVVAVVDTMLLRLVGELAHGGLQDLGGVGDVAAGVFEGVDKHFLLEVGDGLLQRQRRQGSGFLAGLQCGR